MKSNDERTRRTDETLLFSGDIREARRWLDNAIARLDFEGRRAPGDPTRFHDAAIDTLSVCLSSVCEEIMRPRREASLRALFGDPAKFTSRESKKLQDALLALSQLPFDASKVDDALRQLLVTGKINDVNIYYLQLAAWALSKSEVLEKTSTQWTPKPAPMQMARAS